jgi:hypothetical protein
VESDIEARTVLEVREETPESGNGSGNGAGKK